MVDFEAIGLLLILVGVVVVALLIFQRGQGL